MAEKQATEYVVLEQREVNTPSEAGERQANIYFVEADTVEARSAQDAVAKFARANGAKGGKYVAVPSRSFKLVEVAVETQTKLTFK